jgi:hypothetical protein
MYYWIRSFIYIAMFYLLLQHIKEIPHLIHQQVLLLLLESFQIPISFTHIHFLIFLFLISMNFVIQVDSRLNPFNQQFTNLDLFINLSWIFL